MDTEDQTALKIVRIGYGIDSSDDSERVLNFRVGFNDPNGAAAACRIIDQYNEFKGHVVAEAIEYIAAVANRVRFSVGREGSPVVYVSGATGELGKLITAAFYDAGAEECDPIENGYSVRAWWD